MTLKGSLYRKFNEKQTYDYGKGSSGYEKVRKGKGGILKKVGIGIGVIFSIIIILGIIGSTLTPTGRVTETQPEKTTTTSTAINPSDKAIQVQSTTPVSTLTTSSTHQQQCSDFGYYDYCYSGYTCQKVKPNDVLDCCQCLPLNIQMFVGVKEGDLIRFYFVFDDAKAHNGTVSFKILDGLNKTLYTSQFEVKAEQYVDYQYKTTGTPIGKAYEWRVPFNNIPKGFPNILGMGTASMTFTTTDGKTLNADYSLLQIPAYTSDEIKQLYENQYLQSAKVCSSNCVITNGSFQVTLVRWGYFTHLQYDTWGSEVTDYRTDITVKNVGSSESSFSTYDAAMIVNSNQYSSNSLTSQFDGSNIYPGASKNGYLVFENVPNNLAGQARIIVGSAYDSNFNKNSYQFDIQL